MLFAGKIYFTLRRLYEDDNKSFIFQTNDSLVASVIRRNYCHLEQSEKILRQYQKYSELIILYETKGKHEKALRLLQTQAEDPSSSLYGHERTIQYLQNLGNAHRHLIFEFASYVIQHSPEDGLRIFTEDAPEVKNLHRAEVLDYLLKKHKRLVTPYLEHIIFVWKENGALYHNNLIHQYRVTYNDLQADIKNNPNATDVRYEIRNTTPFQSLSLFLFIFICHIFFISDKRGWLVKVCVKNCENFWPNIIAYSRRLF